MKKAINTIKSLQINEISYSFKLKKKRVKSKSHKILKNSYLFFYNSAIKSSKNLYNVYNFEKKIKNCSISKYQVYKDYYININLNKWKRKFKKIKVHSFRVDKFNPCNKNTIYIYNSNALKINSLYIYYSTLLDNIDIDNDWSDIKCNNLNCYNNFIGLIYSIYIKSIINYCFYKNINQVHQH